MKGSIVFLALLQLACALKPHIFSDKELLSNGGAQALPGFELHDQVFKIYFKSPVSNFDYTDIVLAPVLLDDVRANASPVGSDFLIQVDPASWTVTSAQQYSFKIMVPSDRNFDDVPANPQTAVGLTISTAVGACTDVATQVPCEASEDYVVVYAGDLTYTSQSSIDQQVVSIALTFNREVANKNGDYFPFKVTVREANGVLADAAFGTYQLGFATDGMTGTYLNALPGQTICMEYDTTLPAVADFYGNFVGQSNDDALLVASRCFIVDADPCSVYSWAEWSDCTFNGCSPKTSLASANVQTRTKIFTATGSSCANVPESRQCAIVSFAPCGLAVVGQETGSECRPADATSAGTCSVATQQLSGCFCGPECVDNDNCCQSYYKNCMPSTAATDVSLYYKYAPCWEPYTCLTERTTGNPANVQPNVPGNTAFDIFPYCLDAAYYFGENAIPNIVGSSCDPLEAAYGERTYSYQCTCAYEKELDGDLVCDTKKICCGGYESLTTTCNVP